MGSPPARHIPPDVDGAIGDAGARASSSGLPPVSPIPLTSPVPPAPSWAIDCETADRRRRRAPLRALLWAVGSFASLIAIAAAGLETTLIALLIVGFLLMLSRAVTLWILHIPLKNPDRRWTAGPGCVELPSFRAAPRMTRLGAAALIFMTIIISLTTIGFPEEERFRIPSLIVEVVFLILAVMLWLSTGKPHKGPETVLDAEGFQIAPGTRYERVFLWEEQPHIVGGSRWCGHMLIGFLSDSGARPACVPISAFTVGYTQLQRVIDFYSANPELREKLAIGAGLDRVRTLVSFT